MARTGPDGELLALVGSELGAAMGASVEVSSAARLSGGASRETWLLDLDGPPPVPAQVILQQERAGSVGMNLSMSTQADLLRSAASVGVAVPAVLASGGERGSGWVCLELLPGDSVARRILRDTEYDEVRPRLAECAGEAMARIHRMPVELLPAAPPDPLGSMEGLLDVLGEPHPAFEVGLRRLAVTRPPVRPEVVVHGDFRMGNLLVDPHGITAVLDWELAHRGSPIEDLGWFCVRAWRFGAAPRAGGVGSVEQLLTGYAAAGGEVPGEDELAWWEAYGCLRWGLICVLQASSHLSGRHRSVELAAIGRRAAQCEEDLLELLVGHDPWEPVAAEDMPVRNGPHDRPTATELLDAVDEHLGGLGDSLGGSAAFHLRVTRNVLGMVGREMVLGPAQADAHADRLEDLGYPDDAALSAAVRAGALDDRLDEVAAVIRRSVREKLAVSHPGYWRGDS